MRNYKISRVINHGGSFARVGNDVYVLNGPRAEFDKFAGGRANDHRKSQRRDADGRAGDHGKER